MRSSRFSLGVWSALAVGAFVVTATLPAAAAEGVLVDNSIEVRYGDLDLDSAAGIAQLYSRLKTAAEKVCDTGHKPQPLYLSYAWRSCVTAALERGIAAVDRPALAAYHASKANPASRRDVVSVAARN